MARRRLAALSAGILALVVALMGADTATPAAAIVGGAVAPPGATPSIVGHDRPRGHDGQHPAPHRDGSRRERRSVQRHDLDVPTLRPDLCGISRDRTVHG